VIYEKECESRFSWDFLSDRILSSRNPGKVLAQIWVEIWAPFHIQLQKVFQPFYWSHQLESEIPIGQVTIIWPNNSTPNSGSKWLNSNKKNPSTYLSLNFESKLFIWGLGLKKHWIDSLSPTDVHSLVLGTTNPPCDGGSSCHYMMTEKSPVHGIHLYTWYMGHFYPSQALDDPTPLALELENIPHCQKNKNIN